MEHPISSVKAHDMEKEQSEIQAKEKNTEIVLRAIMMLFLLQRMQDMDTSIYDYISCLFTWKIQMSSICS